mgnify:CR=1 FL=1|jgi:hypothetical protein
MRHSRGLLAVAVCALLVTTGCLGFITGSEPIYAEAEPASVDAATLEESDYQVYQSEGQNLTREFSIAGQTREATVRNQIRGYNRTLDLGPLGERDLARFSAFTSPALSIAGQDLNPIGEWSNGRLVEELSGSYGSLSGVEFEQNRTVAALGDSRTVATFAGTATTSGQEVDVRVHVTSFKHGDDYVVAVAVHPERIDEWDRVRRLIGGLEHAE